MKTVFQCSRCQRDMYSAGFSGRCAQCLFAATTRAEAPADDPASFQSIRTGAMVGPRSRFHLIERIGRGGMGEVWLADDREFGRQGEPHLVALKFISEDLRGDKKALELLRAEVLRTQSLLHSSIVRLHDLHTTSDGTPFFKMEYIEANSLDHWLNASEWGMPWPMVCELGSQVASALHYAHQTAGIIHRDVKPSNVLLAAGMKAKLTDFGIAQARHQAEPALQALGTLAYASPQQVRGDPPAPSDDAYSLGAMLYELITGSPPFDAETHELLLLFIESETPEPINDRLDRLGHSGRVPTDLASLISRCLLKDPDLRPSMDKISRVLQQLPGLAEPEPTPLRQDLTWPIRLVLVIIAAVLFRWWTATPSGPSVLSKNGTIKGMYGEDSRRRTQQSNELRLLTNRTENPLGTRPQKAPDQTSATK